MQVRPCRTTSLWCGSRGARWPPPLHRLVRGEGFPSAVSCRCCWLRCFALGLASAPHPGAPPLCPSSSRLWLAPQSSLLQGFEDPSHISGRLARFSVRGHLLASLCVFGVVSLVQSTPMCNRSGSASVRGLACCLRAPHSCVHVPSCAHRARFGRSCQFCLCGCGADPLLPSSLTPDSVDPSTLSLSRGRHVLILQHCPFREGPFLSPWLLLIDPTSACASVVGSPTTVSAGVGAAVSCAPFTWLRNFPRGTIMCVSH